MATLLGAELESKGHSVRLAFDATKAVVMAQEQRPDLMLLDFRLPTGDGSTVYEVLHKNYPDNMPPVIFISAMEPLNIVPSLPKGPSIRLLFKPIDMRRLQDVMRELLSANNVT
ncbi:MAG: response regulator [Elusimicrobia bacterium]|nr:response regulator [Elusimicrobiota bacterium]